MIDYYEHIEAYLEGQLDQDLHSQMNSAISKDPDLKQAVEDFPIAQMISESLIEEEVRSVLAEEKSHPPARRGKYGPWIITITLIAALATSYYQWNRHARQSKLYAAVMKDYTPPINKGNRSIATPNDATKEAVKAFDLREFETSYNLFKTIKPKSDSVRWYLGHIALINGDVYEAKLHSKKISDIKLRQEILQYVDQIISQ